MAEEGNQRIRNRKPIKVYSYSGFKAEERPSSFIFKENEFPVESIVDSWKQEGINPGEGTRVYFKIKAEGDRILTIFYDEKNEEWFLLP